ncbi:lens fiber membrane intrinsic protein-like [Lithobates pipiens]
MISNTASTSWFWLRLAVTILIGIANICLLIAMCTDHWVKANGEDTIDHVGLWRVCSKELCVFHNQFVYAQIFLVIALFIGTSINIVGILALVKDVTYLKYLIARAMYLAATFAFCGMIPTTILLTSLPDFLRIEFGLVFGWIGGVLYLVTGIMSWIHSRIEPDIAIRLDEIRQLISARNTPSYTTIP